MASDKNKEYKPRSVSGPSRVDDDHYKLEWKQASNYTDGSKGWDQVYVNFFANTTKSKILDKKVSVSTTSYEAHIKRAKYYPSKSKGKYRKKLKKMIGRVDVITKNSKTVRSDPVTLTFKKPKKPYCDFDYDDTTGLLTIACTVPKDDIKDAYICHYDVYRHDIKSGSSRYDGKKRKELLNTDGKKLTGDTKEGEFELQTNIEQLQLLPGASITIDVELTSKGFAGDTKGDAEKCKFVIKPPAKVAIKTIDVTNNDTLALKKNVLDYAFATGTVRVSYYTASRASVDYDENAVTDYELWRAVTPYDVDNITKAAVWANWDKVDTNMGTTTDRVFKKNKKIVAKPNKKYDGVMGEAMVDVLTAMGFNNNAHVYDKRVWYRIKSIRQGMVSYSKPVEVETLAFPIPTAKNDYSGFMSIRNSTEEPGTSIDGVVGWSDKNRNDEAIDNENLADAKWTTVVEWSEHKNAVNSNQKPSSLEMDWENTESEHNTVYSNYLQRMESGEFDSIENLKQWAKSANFSIYGLSPGVKYYLWTRRHMVLDSYDEYGPRTEAPANYFPFVPIDNPKTVHVYVDENYVVGTDLTVSWAHDATCDQKAWNIYMCPYNEAYKEGVTVVNRDIPMKLILGGGSADDVDLTNNITIPYANFRANIPACTYETKGNNSKYFDTSKKFGIVVGVSTGGKEILSCANEKGRYIGAAFVDVGYVPSGALALNTKKVQDGSITANTEKEFLNPTLSYRVMSDKSGSSTVTLMDITGTFSDEIQYAQLNCKVEIVNHSTGQVLFAVDDLSVSCGSASTRAINRSFSTSVGKVKIRFTVKNGTYIGLDEVPKPVGASYVDADVDLAKATALVDKMDSSEHVAYLFSRKTEVTGVVNVYAKMDTWYSLPDGEHLQPAGECVLTLDIPASDFGTVESVLSKSEQDLLSTYVKGNNRYPYVARVNIYSHRNMLDGSSYVVEGYLKDTYNENLTSEVTNLEFVHSPYRKAMMCGDDTIIQGFLKNLSQKLNSSTVSIGRGVVNMSMPPSPSVEIIIEKPPNYDGNDTYDLYRMTSDGGVRILADQSFSQSRVVDQFAPFSNDAILRYAIVTVTKDGDMAWREVRYSLKDSCGMRFDWGGADNQRALEMPFNVELKDSYTKDVRIDTYLDGSVAAIFNKSIVRKATNKSKVVRYDRSGIYQDPEKFAMIRELARYTGPVFFRAYNGVAYECVVEVDGIDESYENLDSEISFKLTEINPPSGTFMPSNESRDINVFTPAFKGKYPKMSTAAFMKTEITSSKKNPQPTTVDFVLNDNFYWEHTVLNKKKKEVLQVDKLAKSGVDVKYHVRYNIQASKYSVMLPQVDFDFKKAFDLDHMTNNYYSAIVELTATIDNQVVANKFVGFGKLGRAAVKSLKHSGEVLSINRGSANKVAVLSASAYLYKAEEKSKGTLTTDAVMVGAKNKPKSFSIVYYVDKAVDDKNPDPDAFKLTFGKLSGAAIKDKFARYQIFVKDKPCTDPGFNKATTYAKSNVRELVKKKPSKDYKAVSINVPVMKTIIRRDETKPLYLSLFVYYTDTKGGDPKTTFKGSVQLFESGHSTNSPIYTLKPSPENKQIIIRKK